MKRKVPARKLPGGFFSIERRVLEEDMAGDMPLFLIWVTLIGWANIKDSKAKVGGQCVNIKRGQLVTGRLELSEFWNVGQHVVRRCLDYLEQSGRIVQQNGHHGSIVTICNYDKYQAPRHKDGQPPANHRPTTGQPPATSEQDNKRTIEPKDILLNAGARDPLALEEEEPKKQAIPSPQDLADLWNRLGAGRLPTAVAIKSGTQRYAAAKARLIDEPDLEYWAEVISRIVVSRWCQGAGKNGWCADFDWLVKPDTAPRVLEGKYDGKDTAQAMRRLNKSYACGKCLDAGRIGASRDGGSLAEFACPQCDRGKSNRTDPQWTDASAERGWVLDDYSKQGSDA